MPIQLTHDGVRAMLPKAPQGVVDDFVAKQDLLAAVGILENRNRCAIAFSQVEHETGGFTIKNLTENINYSAPRAAEIWPGRFPPVVNGKGSVSKVREKYGAGAGWQLKMFDDVYSNRMGNRPGTQDGSTYIGRGGPQITGRDGYREVGKRAKLPLEDNPILACAHSNQAAILAGFWQWKNLNTVADTGGLRGVTKIWNGGYIGMADREAMMRGNDPVVARMETAKRVLPAAKSLPGEVPKKPTAEAMSEATKKERGAVAGGVVVGGAGGVAEVSKTTSGTGALVPVPSVKPILTYACIGVGVAIFAVAVALVIRKRRMVASNWF